MHLSQPKYPVWPLTFFIIDLAGKLQTTAVIKTLYLLLPQSSKALGSGCLQCHMYSSMYDGSVWCCTFEWCQKLALQRPPTCFLYYLCDIHWLGQWNLGYDWLFYRPSPGRSDCCTPHSSLQIHALGWMWRWVTGMRMAASRLGTSSMKPVCKMRSFVLFDSLSISFTKVSMRHPWYMALNGCG